MTSDTVVMPRNNLLFSYHFLKNRHGGSPTRIDRRFEDWVLALAPYVNIMIDSGAFSDNSAKVKAAKAGQSYEPIKLEDYINHCKTYYHGRVWSYVMLDVIGNQKETRRHLDIMYDAGLTPMPVFVVTEDYEFMAKLVECYSTRICVAGGVRSGDKFIYQRYQKAYKASGNRAQIHGLGFLRWPDIFQLPLATGDSSTSSSGARFGHLTYYDRRRGFVRAHWKDFLKNPYSKNNLPLVNILRNCDVPIEHLKKEAAYRTSTSVPALFELHATHQFMKHSIENGFGMFSALSSPVWVKMYVSVLSATTHKGFDYPQAVETYKQLGEWWKSDYNRLIQFSVNVFESKTNWRVNTIDEHQKKPEGRIKWKPELSLRQKSS